MSDAPHPKENHPMLIVVMGVCGTGKTTLATALSKHLGMPYIEGDDLHPKANIDKMAAGHPLNDADREPWLELIRTTTEHVAVEQETDAAHKGRRGIVVTCSALKKYYRDILRGTYKPKSVPDHLDPPHPNTLPTYFVFIKGDRELLKDRMEKRKGHYMKVGMLDSQLATLESPEGEDGVVVVDAADTTEKQMEDALEQLTKLAGPL
ncbi:carbohydrate kinase [Gloeophyllum trabeum ATCC 11539]|uniref:Gluconokinase n=1 Tax=Gloeophyllum trabeum (strain ATCC 11539 / FP-39264 / Madison 617) TaxID=670483 RepID=S7RR63_GLOTA|nr:carbohydrate kinase [Gloeophyllum trabeum ATCC 11539]EPQ57100.1 carbohydrate kinase [Gloeophyllum trabeum ATCC 11539]